MSGEVRTLGGADILVCAADGPLLAGPGEAADLVGEALSAGVRFIAVPVARLAPEFLQLRSGVAGEVLQKFVNYGLRAAIVGDVSEAVAASDALRDFVRESNRGRHVWFVADLAELEARLSA